MVRDKPLETLALRRRLGDRLPCTSLTASCDDPRIDHRQKHEPRSLDHAVGPALIAHPPMTEALQLRPGAARPSFKTNF
jgi:hypothetical protein